MAPEDRPTTSSYEPCADAFAAARSSSIGVGPVRDWTTRLPTGARVLDLGCGHGIPIGRALVKAGCRVHGIDLSPSLVAAFRVNLPGATAEVADATVFSPEPGSFDAVVAWGLLFLLEGPHQASVIRNAAAALTPGGRMLATAPWQDAVWVDRLTGRRCVSLGRDRYRQLFRESGLVLTGAGEPDGGGNHYWHLRKPSRGVGAI